MFNFDFEYSDMVWGDKFKSIDGIKFIKVDDAFNFIKNNSSNINIVTHNGDLPIDEKFEKYSHKFPKWFGQNITSKSNKFFSIPIGLENDYVTNSVNKKHMIYDLSGSNRHIVPNKLLYINHNVGTNPAERQKPYSILTSSSWCTIEHSGGFDYQENYYRKILDHACTLSPPGNGVDCHRTWEILYLGRIPVCRRAGRLEELYQDLPVVFFDQYEELNEDFIQNKINETKNKTYNFDKLKFSYWERLVKS